jgi:hypothetical protein
MNMPYYELSREMDNFSGYHKVKYGPSEPRATSGTEIRPSVK